MRIIFMGTPDFAVCSLRKLVFSLHDVLAVVTIPDKQKGRGLKSRPSAVKQFAGEQGIPILQPVSLKDAAFIEALKKYAADVFVVVAFRILPEAVFSIPAMGTINLHGSYLPKYRGAAPINWALMNGDAYSGVSTIQINRRVDTGDLLLQEKVDIDDDMTVGELHDILAEHGAGLILKTLDGIADGSLVPKKQDNSLACKAPKITKEICHLDFYQKAKNVHNHVRGLSPNPGAYVLWENKPLKIFRTRPTDKDSSLPPGRISRVERRSFFVQCMDFELEVLEVQAPGKKRMGSAAFLNGNTFAPSTLLK